MPLDCVMGQLIQVDRLSSGYLPNCMQGHVPLLSG